MEGGEMKHLIAGFLVICAGTAGAQNTTPEYDVLVLEALVESTAERDAFEEMYLGYEVAARALVDAGTYTIVGPTDDRISFDTELVGVYEDATRTFTWGWATDLFPTLERTAANTVKAYGRANNIPELTSPRSIGGSIDARVRSSVATVVANLDLVTAVPSGELTIYIGLPDAAKSGS
jgi:hypothetical protein